jgi:hypothetical protein
MTPTLASTAHATHADGLAIFHAVIGALEAVGWTRLRVDTLKHPDAGQDVVQHSYSAGVWTLTFGPDPYWVKRPARRIALIDRRRPPLPSTLGVLSDLFGARIALARPPAGKNGANA